jgi:hypothetical protein
LDHAFFQQREARFGLGRGDHLHPVAKGLARGHAALELLHALIVAHARHFQAADAVVAAHFFVEVDAVLGGENRQLIVHRVEAEIGRVRGRPDVGGDARLVDAHDVVPTPFDQVVCHRGTHDAPLSNDDDSGTFGKFGHLGSLL